MQYSLLESEKTTCLYIHAHDGQAISSPNQTTKLVEDFSMNGRIHTVQLKIYSFFS